MKGIKKFVGFWILFTYLFLFSAVAGCVFISAFASLSCILVGITSSATELKIFVITAGIKNYESN